MGWNCSYGCKGSKSRLSVHSIEANAYARATGTTDMNAVFNFSSHSCVGDHTRSANPESRTKIPISDMSWIGIILI